MTQMLTRVVFPSRKKFLNTGGKQKVYFFLLLIGLVSDINNLQMEEGKIALRLKNLGVMVGVLCCEEQMEPDKCAINVLGIFITS